MIHQRVLVSPDGGQADAVPGAPPADLAEDLPGLAPVPHLPSTTVVYLRAV